MVAVAARNPATKVFSSGCDDEVMEIEIRVWFPVALWSGFWYPYSLEEFILKTVEIISIPAFL